MRWEEYLHLVEFSYNNGYHASLKLIPFKVLYGRRCRILGNWNSLEDKLMLGLEMLKEMEPMVKRARHNLKEAKDQHKVYAD